MGVLSNSRFIKLIVNLLFLVLPTLAVFYFTIDQITDSFKFLERDKYTEVCIILIFGCLSYSFSFFKIRSWITILPFITSIYFLTKYINSVDNQEFDSFFYQIKFQHYIVLSVFSWAIGFTLSRFRYTSYVFSVLCTIIGVYFILSHEIFDLAKLLNTIFPILIYGFYSIYVKEILEDLSDTKYKRIGGLLIRLTLFIVVLWLSFQLSKYFLDAKFTQFTKDIAGALSKEGKSKSGADKDKLLKENEDGTFDINEIAKLDKRQNTATGNAMKELLFVTYLDNFLSGSDNYPMPYYYVSYYLNKYDTIKEQFVKDKNAPLNDAFNPLPQQLPLLISLSDSSVLNKISNFKARETKEVLIYTDKLNPNHFTAPANAYSVEPIPVDPDFKNKYKFAYRAKSYVSYLNEAFFVYNNPHPIIEMFNKQRDIVLASEKSYKGINQKFINYYTEVPKTKLHDSISDLAHEITKGCKTPIDKVVKVRNYFKQKDAAGKPLFKYTLEVMKASEPNIPNQKMLSNFLFKTHKGYCTYYSAASLFMLRSLGIPTRFTAGFLIEDRSAGKNQGWYTVYGSQAHAWIQVYFPSYGWLDFDNTIPAVEEDKENAPKPDGTPPLSIPKVYFSGHGKIVSVDTATKTLVFTMSQMNFKNREYSFENPPAFKIDYKKSKIFKNKEIGKISDISKNIELSTVVYANIFQKIKLPEQYGSSKAFVEAMPNPTPVDEIYLKIPEKVKTVSKTKPIKAKESVWPFYLLWTIVGLVIFIVVILLLSPTIVYYYYRFKANSSNNLDKKAYYIHMLALFVFNQLGYYRGSQTSLKYSRLVIDPVFNVGYETFIITYLKLKYSEQSLNQSDELVINEFYPRFISQINSQINFRKKLNLFFNYVMLQKFFALPEED